VRNQHPLEVLEVGEALACLQKQAQHSATGILEFHGQGQTAHRDPEAKVPLGRGHSRAEHEVPVSRDEVDLQILPYPDDEGQNN